MHTTSTKTIRKGDVFVPSLSITNSVTKIILNIEKQNIIEAMQSTQSIASFQDAVGNDDQNELSLSDIISLDPETLKHYHDHLDLKNAFDCLNQREKKVIQERYYQGYSQCEIADELFVSQAQISRIEKKALEKLHKKLV